MHLFAKAQNLQKLLLASIRKFVDPSSDEDHNTKSNHLLLVPLIPEISAKSH